MSVRPSTCITSAPTGRIFVKSHIGDFYENLSRNSKYGQSRTKLSDTLPEGLSKFYCWRRQSVAIKALLAATGGGEGGESKYMTCYVTTSVMWQLGTPLSARYEPSLIQRTVGCQNGHHWWSIETACLTRFYSNWGQGIIECISSSAHALLLAHGNKGYANAPQQ
jgi:hypothetical protein